MKVIKLPEFCDPNFSILHKIIEDNCTCPFCGHSHDIANGFEGNIFHRYMDINSVISDVIGYGFTRYGIGRPWYKHLADKPCHWFTLRFICSHCKGEWETDEYPLFNLEDKVISYGEKTIEI